MLNKFKYVLNRNRCYCQTDVSQEQLQKMIQQDAVLLDVRSPQEYAEEHLKDAISMPEYEIEKMAEKILPDKNQTIIVYCSTGHRSKKAQKHLEKLGYKKVFNLCDGLLLFDDKA